MMRFELLLFSGADAMQADNRGTTPLHYAAFGGHPEVARLLLVEHGADDDRADNGGRTPAHRRTRRPSRGGAGAPRGSGGVIGT